MQVTLQHWNEKEANNYTKQYFFLLIDGTSTVWITSIWLRH